MELIKKIQNSRPFCFPHTCNKYNLQLANSESNSIPIPQVYDTCMYICSASPPY